MRTVTVVLALLLAPGLALGDGAAEHGARALKAYKAADYETALKEYEEFTKEKGSTPVDIQILIARSLDRLFRSNEAIVAYTRFVHGGVGRPEIKEAHDRIAFLKKHLAQGATPETLAKQHIERGAALYKLELFTEARAEFEGAVTALPDKPNGYRWLGLSLERLGNCKQAVTNFDTFASMVASDDPRLEEVTEVRSRCVAKLGAEAAAARPLPAPARPAADDGAGAGSEIDSKVKQHVDRGIELYSNGRLSDAREEFTVARSLAPDKATPFRWLGIVDARLERCPEAIANLEVFLEKVQASDARVPEAKEILAACKDKAAPHAAHVAAPKPVTPPPPPPETPEQRAGKLLEKGAALYQQAKYKDARDAFETARALLPERANAYRWIGLVDARLGKCREALASFDTFLSRVPTDDNRVPEVEDERARCRKELAPKPVAVVVMPRPQAAAPAPAPASTIQPGPVAASPAPLVVTAPPEAAGRAAPDRSGINIALPISVGAGAVLLFGVGAALNVVGSNEFNNLKVTCSPNCTPDEVQPVRAKLYTSYALFGLGAAAAAADGFLWWLYARQDKAPPHVMLSPTTNGAQVSGTF